MKIWAAFAGALAGVCLAGSLHASPRALLIGVADVPNNELPGIDLDIDNMKKVAAIMGFKPGDIKVLYNEQATYANVTQALATWVRDGVGEHDHVLIYFSGHGTRVPDPDPANAGGVDDALVLHDVQRATIQGKASLRNVLIGHEFGAALAKIPSRDVLVLVDACHSGTATRDFNFGLRRLPAGVGHLKFFYYAGMPAGSVHTRALRAPTGSENYAALSAARDEEFAVGTEHGGLFTLGVVQAIQNAARDRHSPTLLDVRGVTTTFIAEHTDEQSRHHPTTDGNERLIKGELALIPLQGGQGPTWQSLATLAAKGEPLTLSGEARQIRVGDEVTLDVAVPRDGYLNVVTVDSQDRATVLFPNKFASSNAVRAGHFKFPTADMSFVVRASEPLGPSLVVAFLTDKPVSLLELGIEGRDAAGKMEQVFTEISAGATRALVIEARQRRYAAGSLSVTVEGKAAH
jgi:metacaspase-1